MQERDTKIVRIVAIYSVIATIYAIILDSIYETEIAQSAIPLKGVFFTVGLIFVCVYALKQLRKSFGESLRYWHSFIVCFCTIVFTFILFRLYALTRYRDFEYVAENYVTLIKGALVSPLVLSAIISLFFRKGKPNENENQAENIQAMFDIDMKLTEEKTKEKTNSDR